MIFDCGTCYLWLSCVQKLKIHSHGKWTADRQCTAKSAYLARHQEDIIGLRTGGYSMAYKLQRHADFVISKPNLLTTLCSGVLYLYRFGGRYYLDWASETSDAWCEFIITRLVDQPAGAFTGRKMKRS